MDIKFENIAEWGKLHRKIKNNRGWFYEQPSQDTIDGYRVQMFTLDKIAKQDSVHNLEVLKQKARDISASVLIVKGTEIQFVGTDYDAYMSLNDEKWMDRYRKAMDSGKFYYSKPFWTHSGSDLNFHTFSLYAYGSDSIFALAPQKGFYDVEKDCKVTNRKQQIEKLWDLGWVSRRGRPVSVGNEKYSGSREEIVEITKLANSMWSRRNESEVAKKICSCYTSINRDFCWPGSW